MASCVLSQRLPVVWLELYWVRLQEQPLLARWGQWLVLYWVLL
jgi:hypothetical protein